MKVIRLLLAAVGLYVCGASHVEAHAFVDHAEPKVGAMVAFSPDVVKVWFTRKLKPGASTLAVFDAGGHEVDGRDARVDPNDATRMTVSMPKSPAGTYKVVWTAVCLDGHTTHASFTFTVAAVDLAPGFCHGSG